MQESSVQTKNASVDDEAFEHLETGVYRHYKGGLYRVHALAHEEASLEPVVVYTPLYETDNFPQKSFWTRLLSEFLGPVSLPTGETVPRFTYQKQYDNWFM